MLPGAAALVTAQPDDCTDCPADVVLVWDDDVVATAVQAIAAAVITILLVGLGVVLVRRWRSFGKLQRSALAPSSGPAGRSRSSASRA